MVNTLHKTETTPLLDEIAAAEYLRLSPKALRNWRQNGNGPVFVRISSRCIRYEVPALQEFIESKRRKSTSE